MSGEGWPVRAKCPCEDSEFNDLENIGMLAEVNPTVKQTIIEGMLKERGNRSIEGVERDTMLLQVLSTHAKAGKS
jgi:hypothetical protein